MNIPEWQPDQDMGECASCGYSLRPGWTKCPVCDTPVGEKASEDVKEEPKESSEDVQDEVSEQEADSKEETDS